MQRDELGADSPAELVSSTDEDEPEQPPSKQGPGTPQRKRRIRRELSSAEREKEKARSKTFQTAWFSESAFKGWPKSDPNGDPVHSYCSACDKRLRGGESELLRHAERETHTQKASPSIKSNKSIETCFSAASAEKVRHQGNVKTFEISLSAYFADHNIAVESCDHLIRVLKKSETDSQIVRDFSLDKTKCTAIMVARTETEQIGENLKQTVFSVQIDESTYMSSKKNMYFIVKYICRKTGKIRIDLLELIELDSKDCSAAKLSTAYFACLKRHGIPPRNILALACDNAPVMVGGNNSFFSKLRDIVPWLLLFNCICHSVHLVSSNACKKLPAKVKKLIQSTSSYVTGSPKRPAELREFADFYKAEYGKLLRLSFTRWLILHPCVTRFLEIHPVLKEYFRLAVFEDAKDTEAAWILGELKRSIHRGIYMFPQT